jgi:hypothetical protein
MYKMELFWFWFRVGEIGGIFHVAGKAQSVRFTAGDRTAMEYYAVVSSWWLLLGPWMPEYAARQ